MPSLPSKEFLPYFELGLAVLSVALIKKLYTRKPPAPYPPGPRKWPLLGNLLDMPSSQEWFTYTKWGEKYGDMIAVEVFGQPMIIVNSAQLAIDMLDKQGAIYSERPTIPMGGELVGWKNTLVFLRYGPRHRNFRKNFHQLIGTQEIMTQFHPIEETETHIFLKSLLKSPENLYSHVRQTAGAIILRLAYGYEVQEKNDPLVGVVNEAMEQFTKGSNLTAFLVNLVPPLQYVPEWMPGAGFKKIAKAWAATLNEMVERPLRFVKDKMASGDAQPSFTSKLLQDPEMTSDKEFDIKWSAASLYSGGADTTVSAIYSFFKAMALFPEVVKKAQAEIDAVIGPNRLPSLKDRQDLPYINAIVLEVIRWHSVVPLGVPHVAAEDSVFNGYFIPKGAYIITNIWRMLHDPEIYPDPMAFKPERFLGPNPQPDPRKAYFGFGRRICPGRALAEVSTFISVAMTLAVFDISKAVVDGKVIEPVNDQTSGVVSHPLPFQVSIKPRSEKAVALINSEIEYH